MTSNRTPSSQGRYTHYHDPKKHLHSHRQVETAPIPSLTRPGQPSAPSRNRRHQKRKLHDETTAHGTRLPAAGLRPERQAPPPRAPLPASRRHSPLKRPELSMGPGKRLGSPAPNMSQLSKPTYFFHCLNQRLSTRYLQHTAPGGAAPSAAARPTPSGPAARRERGRRGKPTDQQRSPGLPRPQGRGQQRSQLGPLHRRLRPRAAAAAALGRRHVGARVPSRADVGPRTHARWVGRLRWPRPARAPSDGVGGAARRGGAGGAGAMAAAAIL